MRERMVEHRVRADCIQCHRMMDPIGFALENFDAVGLWRSHEEGTPVDASGQLFDNKMVNGPVELRAWLRRLFAAVCTRWRRKDAHLRARPRARIPGHAARPCDCARGGPRQQQVLGAGDGDRQEPAIPDEYEAHSGTGGAEQSTARIEP